MGKIYTESFGGGNNRTLRASSVRLESHLEGKKHILKKIWKVKNTF